MKLQVYYLYWSIFLFIVELFIAIYIDDNFIRPYIGDVFVVILIYAIAKTFFKVSILKAAVSVLIFAFLVEILQYFKIVDFLGLGDFQLARVIIGTSFSVKDFVAYSVGFLLILLLEYARKKYKSLRNYMKKRSQYYN